MNRHNLLVAITTILPACQVGGPLEGTPIEESASPDRSLGRSASELRFFPGTRFELVAPETCADLCTLRIDIEGPRWPVATVTYTADGWPLGRSSDSGSSFEHGARFFVGGDRWVKAEARSAWGTTLGESEALVHVRLPGADAPSSEADERGTEAVDSSSEPLPPPPPPPARSSGTPYFYQYANALAPYATCQNTSIAMVLAQHGWQGRPDDITAEFGRSRAQSPAGLASVFNTLASRAGLTARLEPTSSGTLAGLRAELDAGGPVIVHGYLTRFGHVVVVTGYDRHGYYVNDPAGRWNERFGGGYPDGYDSGAGRGVHYPRAAFEAAIATSDGQSHLPLWYHAVR